MHLQANTSLENGKVLSRKMAADADLMDAMGEAYDRACRLLHDNDQPEFLQKLIARRAVELAEQVIVAQIIEVAATGERDPNEMCKKALETLGFPVKRAHLNRPAADREQVCSAFDFICLSCLSK